MEEVEEGRSTPGQMRDEAAASKDKTSSTTGSVTLSSFYSDIVLRGEKSREGVSAYEDVRDVLAAFIKLRYTMLTLDMLTQ